MLMNLLAESQGLPEAFRILSLFEHQFGMLWEPNNLRMFQKRPEMANDFNEKKKLEESDDDEKKTKLQTLVVAWDDAEIADYVYR